MNPRKVEAWITRAGSSFVEAYAHAYWLIPLRLKKIKTRVYRFVFWFLPAVDRWNRKRIATELAHHAAVYKENKELVRPIREAAETVMRDYKALIEGDK